MAYNKHTENTTNSYAWDKLRDPQGDWEFAVLHIRSISDNVIKKGEPYWYVKEDMIVLVPKNNVHLPWIPKEMIDKHQIEPDYKLEICISRSELVSVEFFKPASKLVQVPAIITGEA